MGKKWRLLFLECIYGKKKFSEMPCFVNFREDNVDFSTLKVVVAEFSTVLSTVIPIKNKMNNSNID